MKSPFFIGKNMSATEKLVEFAVATFSTELPDSVRAITIQAIIDQYGLQIGGSEFPWSKAIYRYVTKDVPTSGNSSITRYGNLVSPMQAAFINGCFGHAQDFDDSHQEAQTHPGSVVIPAAIAVGEHLSLPGKTVLKAIAIGMEIMLRLAASLCPACIEGGHHTPPTIGPFGSAITCGLLLGLNKTQLVNALGICGSNHAGGLVEYTVSGGSVKRIHTGLGARAGLEAVLLARHGITGPTPIIEGKKGMWAVFGKGKEVPDRLFNKIGEKYLLNTIMFKPYNCCYLIHPAIQVFLDICKKNQIKPNDIENVTVGMSKFSVSHAGTIKIPKDELGAQFSTSFTLALALIKGEPGLWSYSEENLVDPKIIELAKKIDVYEDEEANAEFPKKNGAIVNVTTNKGAIFTVRIKEPKGSPTNLLTLEEVKQKFMKNVSRTLDESEANNLYDRLVTFEAIEDLSQLKFNTTITPQLSKL